MTYRISTTTRLELGQTWTVSDTIGVNIVAPADGHYSVSFINAGTLLLTTNSPYIVTGINYDYGSTAESSFFINELTGVVRIISTGGSPTYGFTSGQGFAGFNGDFINHGLFEVQSNSGAIGALTSDRTFVFSNTGNFLISAGIEAIGVRAANGATITNDGDLIVTSTHATGLLLLRDSTVVNNGLIHAISTATDGRSVGVSFSHPGSTISYLTNTGRIEAQYAVLDVINSSPPQMSAQFVDNSGEIIGLIDLALGDDFIHNSGLIQGDIWLGYGQDIYNGGQGRQVGIVHGGFGDDVLIGGAQADFLFGEDGDDIIDGGAGDDFIQGGRGSDDIQGGTGIDTLIYAGLTRGVEADLAAGRGSAVGDSRINGIENIYGSIWNDRLLGDSGANLFFGYDGDDVLNGLDGADTLVGGTGSDVLTGGAGADLFRFGSGDGADEITDLSVEDRLVIHGYASWQSIEQIGSDTLVRLSATDTILLRGMSPAAAAPLISFNSSARPTYTTPDHPEQIDDAHVEIYGAMEIVQGETLIFDHGLGTLAVQRDFDNLNRPGGLTNGGDILVTNASPYGLAGVSVSSIAAGAWFTQTVTGSLIVHSTHASAERVYGVAVHDSLVAINNAGLIEVTGGRATYGIAALGGLELDVYNTGRIIVQGLGDARGINLGPMGYAFNAGLIEVSGSGLVNAIQSYSQSELINTGTITAFSSSGVATGVFFRSDVISIQNSGLISAATAINVESYSPQALGANITNSGELRGQVLLTSYDDTLVNTGLITGEIRMNGGNDTFDGSAGQHIGDVHGNAGQDRLIGSAFADVLYGDEGSDSLTGGAGNDQLIGGEGDDFAVFSGPRSAYSWTINGDTITVTGPDGIDTLEGIELLRFSDELVSLTGFGIRMNGSGGDDIIVGSELGDVLSGGAVPPLFEWQGSTDNGRDRLFGEGGDDILSGGGNDDYLDGGTGDDRLDGGLMNDTLFGGAGDDVLIGGDDHNVIHGGSGFDTLILTGPRSQYEIYIGEGVVSVVRYEANQWSPNLQRYEDLLTSVERIQFSDGVLDLRTVRQAGTTTDDVLYGDGGDSLLEGDGGDDRLYGGAGDDELYGGEGHDLLDGGEGYDIAVVDGAQGDYRIVRNGDIFILKGTTGGTSLVNVEGVRFGDGSYLDLARQYGFNVGEDHLQIRPTGPTGKESDFGLLVLPGDWTECSTSLLDWNGPGSTSPLLQTLNLVDLMSGSSGGNGDWF